MRDRADASRLGASIVASCLCAAAAACASSDEGSGDGKVEAAGGAGASEASDGGNGGDGSPASAASGDFLALSYNVAGLPDVLSGSEPETNMPFIAPLLNDYDLVLVQESWLTPDPNPFGDQGLRVYHEILVAEAEHPYQSEPADQPFGNDESRPTALLSDGLNRFSEFPFDEAEVDRQAWTDCFGDASTGAGDCLAFKGFSMATHTLSSGVDVDIYNLHAEAGSTDTDQALQVDNFVQLGDYIVANSEGRAIILGGDTNLHTDQQEDRAIWDAFLERTGLVDVCAAIDCGADADLIDKFAFRNTDAITIEALSHEFARDKFVRPTDGEPLSDHPPLVVRFGWARSE